MPKNLRVETLLYIHPARNTSHPLRQKERGRDLNLIRSSGESGSASMKAVLALLVMATLAAVILSTGSAYAALTGAAYTTTKDAAAVDKNIYAATSDVYLSGGPQNLHASGLPDGIYYFQVTDPSGKVLLSTDNAVCRQLKVAGGRVVGAAGPCPHANGTPNAANGATPVQLAPFSVTPNAGGEYKAWIISQVGSTSISGSDPKVINFSNPNSKTDNFKILPSTEPPPPPPGSCQPSSSLSVLVTGTNVTAYVPKGSWSFGSTGVSVVNVEGSSVTPTLIPTANVVNSCASNALTGQTVCTANNTDVYLLSGTSLTGTLSSGGSGSLSFSGGGCTNCGVAMDATHNKAVIGLAVGGAPGFQFLNLGSSSFEPAFNSPSGEISEDPLIDPIRNLLLSAAENNTYEVVDVANSIAPAFFENAVVVPGELDSSGEDCTTGIALAPAEFSSPSVVYLADLTQATFTSGAPGSWTAPSQAQSLSESFLSAGASGIAVAQGTHTGVVTGEFGGDALTAIALPATSGSGTPAIGDWMTCGVSGFNMGFDPHTVTAYQSPNGGHAIAVIANDNASSLAIVDLTRMLDPAFVPRTGAGHGSSAGSLPASVVTFISVP
ncbi:MAG TPA: hypothetical protein VE642_11685 [Pyrinomonadaceae bacterium]|nr:hypothetical protein [Pyrinomonadaceae bacterium]